MDSILVLIIRHRALRYVGDGPHGRAQGRLQVLVESGDESAAVAMRLHDDTRFLSVVQIGITSIGVLNGIIGESAFSAPLAHWLESSFRLANPAWPTSPPPSSLVVAITFSPHHLRRAGAQAHRADVSRVGGHAGRPPMEVAVHHRPPVCPFAGVLHRGRSLAAGLARCPARQVTGRKIAASLEEGWTPA